VHSEDQAVGMLVVGRPRGDEIDGDELAVATTDLAFDVSHVARREIGKEIEDARSVAGQHEVVDIGSEQVAWPVAERALDRGALVANDAGVVQDEDEIRDIAKEGFLASMQLMLPLFVAAFVPTDHEPGDDRYADEQDQGALDQDLRPAADDRCQRDVDEHDGRAGKENAQRPLTSKSASKPAGMEMRGHRWRLGP
jgi:hypothetical protein